jgi:hypothetical protein
MKFSIKLSLTLTFLIACCQSSLLKKQEGQIGRKLQEDDEQKSLVDVRGILDQREGDNPLSDLFDANHMKIARQNVNLNMNMPLNRLKLHLDNTYQVKIVVENDEDFDRLYDYFYPKKEEEPLEKENEINTEQHSKIKKFVK